jgi:hypothetical protein
MDVFGTGVQNVTQSKPLTLSINQK